MRATLLTTERTLATIYTPNDNNKTAFCPHLCVSRDSHNKQSLFPETTLTGWSLLCCLCVFTLRYGLSFIATCIFVSELHPGLIWRTNCYWDRLRFVSIIPPNLYNLHLNSTLIRRTSGRSLEAFKQSNAFFGEHWAEKYCLHFLVSFPYILCSMFFFPCLYATLMHISLFLSLWPIIVVFREFGCSHTLNVTLFLCHLLPFFFPSVLTHNFSAVSSCKL
jgi:hypothetical protein